MNTLSLGRLFFGSLKVGFYSLSFMCLSILIAFFYDNPAARSIFIDGPNLQFYGVVFGLLFIFPLISGVHVTVVALYDALIKNRSSRTIRVSFQ